MSWFWRVVGIAPAVLFVALLAPAADKDLKGVAKETKAVEIVAHRGASADAPENTLAALKLGYEQGADADELDVHLTKDGKVVVIHDADTKRTAGVDRKVAEQTFDEIRKVDVGGFGKWQGKGFSERVPTLDEVLAIVPRGKRLFVEIKTGPEAVPALAECFGRSEVTPAQTVIISFNFAAAKAAKERFPDRQVLSLHSYKKDEKTGEFPKIDDLIAKAKDAGLDGLDLDYHFPLDAAAVGRIKAAGLACHVWTVDDPAAARRLTAAGVDGITTNRPAGLRADLRAPPASP